MRREQEIREEAERQEAKLLLALKEAQLVVPQTVHLDNTKLPTMTKGEDIEVFIELFETAMRVGGVPEDKWTSKLHAALDTDTKLTVKDVMTNADSTYEEIKQALVGQGHLTFTAASEALMTLDDGNITELPMRQAIQKLARFYEKATAEATSIRETCLYSAVATARFFLQPDVKQYVDVKGTFDNDGFCRSIEEWQRTHPLRKTDLGTRRLGHQDRQPNRVSSGKKPGSCFHCGKGGNFAYECRSRLAGDRPAAQRSDPPVLVVKREQSSGNKAERDMSEVTCFRCRKKGHISPQYSSKSNKVKRIKIPAEKMVSLRETRCLVRWVNIRSRLP